MIHCHTMSTIKSTLTTTSVPLFSIRYSFVKDNHPKNVKRGGVGLYIKDSLASKNRSDLVTLPECIVYKIQVNVKKYFFAVIYRGPSQGPEEFDNFTINFELMLSKMHSESPFRIIITGDFNCRSTQWWKMI